MIEILEMMIGMMIMLLCVRVSVLMTSNATFLLSNQIQACHELGYDQKVLSPKLSRKLMLKNMDEGYGDQELVFYNDKKKALNVGETWKREEEVMVIGAQGSDPTEFTTMDYSHVRRRRPIHNNSSPKPTNSP
ncbi:hypothetical protein L1987_10912 [Smallanthus sonchifolius]|uniref:Uncharacterized protein n=1 Tax=Smallanthus sonchifolius TaxID=185202 RepID=A0ACB9JAZ0_9ASTR|nr:hypothetical protein L1987_10912 [Smallanthus sonchifolius]